MIEHTPRAFITDMGAELTITGEDGAHVGTLPRYGLWQWNGRKWEVTDTGTLEELRTRHGADLKVYVLIPGGGGAMREVGG